ncbi:hypothetical protein V8C40DRAFT_55248 [Trichoderma camerunense]
MTSMAWILVAAITVITLISTTVTAPAQIRYGPRGIDASSEQEPGPAQRRTSPSVVSHASPSLIQAVTASCSRCWPKQTRPGNAALRGHSAHLSVKAAAVGCRVRPLIVLSCLQWLCVVVFAALFLLRFVCTFPSLESFLSPSPRLLVSQPLSVSYRTFTATDSM